MENCLNQLREITRGKLSLLIADQLEIKRQIDIIDWNHCFMEHFSEILEPVDFLLEWNRYLNYKREILQTINIPSESLVRNDIRCIGNLKVADGNVFFEESGPQD